MTQLIDLRNSGSRNSRYMINQLLADNGRSDSTVVVMLTAASPVTISVPTPTLDLAALIGAANATALSSGVVASIVSQATTTAAASSATASVASAAAAASASAAASNITDLFSKFPNVAAFNASNPFGQIGQTIILPYGSVAPALPNGAQIVVDPANIILPNQASLLVEDINQLSSDCSFFSSNSLSLFNLASSVVVSEQISVVELGGLSIGSSSLLNSVAAALLAGGNSNSVLTTTTTTSQAAVSTTTSSSTTTTTSVVATTTVVAAAAAVVSSAAAVAAVAAPAVASAASGAGGVGVQVVPIAAA